VKTAVILQYSNDTHFRDFRLQFLQVRIGVIPFEDLTFGLGRRGPPEIVRLREELVAELDS